MNPSTPSSSPEPNPASGGTEPPAIPSLPADASLAVLLEALLKRPALLVEALQRGSARFTVSLAVGAILALAAYGLLVGTFSGGQQLMAAPLKISLGAAFSMLICLPSLFIFASLTGANVTLRGVAGILCAALALTGLLLIGFAPVAWVFSQSTESVAFIGFLHLSFWLISLGFGLRLLNIFMDVLRVQDRFHIRVWTFLFILVSLQMTTSLRPIIGKAPTWLPTEKKFFLEHWFDTLNTPRPTTSTAPTVAE